MAFSNPMTLNDCYCHSNRKKLVDLKWWLSSYQVCKSFADWPDRKISITKQICNILLKIKSWVKKNPSKQTAAIKAIPITVYVLQEYSITFQYHNPCSLHPVPEYHPAQLELKLDCWVCKQREYSNLSKANNFYIHKKKKKKKKIKTIKNDDHENDDNDINTKNQCIYSCQILLKPLVCTAKNYRKETNSVIKKYTNNMKQNTQNDLDHGTCTHVYIYASMHTYTHTYTLMHAHTHTHTHTTHTHNIALFKIAVRCYKELV